MTSEQKSVFCDEYCRHLYLSNEKLRRSKGKLDFSDYQELVCKESMLMTKICTLCPLSKEKDET